MRLNWDADFHIRWLLVVIQDDCSDYGDLESDLMR